MTNLDLKVLLFFLASYKTLALCGHPVIEKMQKILLYDTLFAFFDEKKLVILASRLRWEEVRAILEGFINLGHKYSFKSWLCSCEDEFQKNSKLTGPGLELLYIFDRESLDAVLKVRKLLILLETFPQLVKMSHLWQYYEILENVMKS